MRVYHFLNRQYGLENIRRRRLKIATLDDLNDPFEMLAAGSTDPRVRAALLRTKEEMATRAGLLCFSRAWHNAVQWAHYAESHRGLCLGFDVADRLLHPVRYRRYRMAIDPAVIEAGGGAAEAFMQELIGAKSSHWRYENEVRCFVSLDERDPETQLYFADFSDDLALREVIIGHRSTVGRAELADALGSLAPQVRTRKARLAFRSFRIVTQRQNSLWT